MATIKDAHAPATDRTRISTDPTSLVRLEVTHARITGRAPAVAVLDRAEFIRAIETELDGTWINHADLPKVRATPSSVAAGSIGWTKEQIERLPSRAAFARQSALDYLAVARYLEANPPLDEEKVDAIAGVIDSDDEPSDLTTEQIFRIARRLVQAGVRAPETIAQ